MVVRKRRSQHELAASATGLAASAAAAGDEVLGKEEHRGGGLDFRVLATITLVVAGPYAVYVAHRWLHLQSGLLRAPVPDSGQRQVLIVGTQSAGTTAVAAGLQALGLEVEHEYSDTKWSFCRDGTVSWFHGLRFLPGTPSNQSLALLCARWYDNMGFHPAMFRSPRRGCSYRSKWDSCWAAECVDLLSAEWGCGLSERCETPYVRELLLVRHPLRTIESLVSKFCLDYGGTTKDVHPYLVVFTHALFPGTPLPHYTKHDIHTANCLEVVGWYYVAYIEAMLQAEAHGAIDSFVRVEEQEPCAVARAAGFLNASLAVDAATHALVQRACSAGGSGLGPRERRNTRNKGRVTLGYQDLWEGQHARVRQIATRLGYGDVSDPG